jgi:hypothetical protein
MDFGIFMEFEVRQGGDQARSVLAAPIVVASSIATRTKRLRIGMAVQVLPPNGRSGLPRVSDMW